MRRIKKVLNVAEQAVARVNGGQLPAVLLGRGVQAGAFFGFGARLTAGWPGTKKRRGLAAHSPA